MVMEGRRRYKREKEKERERERGETDSWEKRLKLYIQEEDG